MNASCLNSQQLQELFGNDTFMAVASGPMSFDGSFRRSWVAWRRSVPGPWLHPLNLFLYVDISGTDPSQWKLLKVSLQVLPGLQRSSSITDH